MALWFRARVLVAGRLEGAAGSDGAKLLQTKIGGGGLALQLLRMGGAGKPTTGSWNIYSSYCFSHTARRDPRNAVGYDGGGQRAKYRAGGGAGGELTRRGFVDENWG